MKIAPENTTVLIHKDSDLNVLGRTSSEDAYRNALIFLEAELKKNPDNSEAWL